MDDLFNSARRLTAGLAEATIHKAETENELYGVHQDLAEAAPRTFADIFSLEQCRVNSQNHHRFGSMACGAGTPLFEFRASPAERSTAGYDL